MANQVVASEPKVIWRDADGDRLTLSPAWNHLAVESDGGVGILDLPTDPADKVRLLSNLVDAMGMEWDGLREKPRPFRVGDVVKVAGHGTWTVIAVGENRLFGRGVTTGAETSWRLSSCTLITPAEEVEQGEVEQSEEHECGLFIGRVCAECGKVPGSTVEQSEGEWRHGMEQVSITETLGRHINGVEVQGFRQRGDVIPRGMCSPGGGVIGLADENDMVWVDKR